MQSEARYNGVAQFLHWLMATVIIVAWSIGLYAAEMPRGPDKLSMIGWHKGIASTVLVLIVLRILWRATHAAPALSSAVPALQQKLAGLAHFLIYLLMIALPMSGWLWSSAAGYSVKMAGFIELPSLMAKNDVWKENLGEVHEVLAFTLAGLVAVHVLAALKHHFFNRDGVLLRMMPAKHR